MRYILPVKYFNSRPHGGRQFSRRLPLPTSYFNSRPHGGRPCIWRDLNICCIFQLTPSRRATIAFDGKAWKKCISTHALTEGDHHNAQSALAFFDFNSRPHGGRPLLPIGCIPGSISTHALTEGDRSTAVAVVSSLYFNSRPHGGRRRLWPECPPVPHISTHALTEGDRFR